MVALMRINAIANSRFKIKGFQKSLFVRSPSLSTRRGVRSSAERADSTLRSSWAIPHPSTNRAQRRLTSEVGRDPVHSTRYGRQRTCRSRRVMAFCIHFPVFYLFSELLAEGVGPGNNPPQPSGAPYVPASPNTKKLEWLGENGCDSVRDCITPYHINAH